MSSVPLLTALLAAFVLASAVNAQAPCAAPLPAVRDGIFPNSCANSVNGSVCTAVCRAGYTSTPTPTTTCMNGNWSSPSVVCQRVCSGMPTATLTGGTWPSTCNGTTRFNTYCAGVCNAGWTGSPRVLCGNGWDTKVQGKCVQGTERCSTKPVTVLNGVWPDSCLDSAVGDVCDAVCNMNKWFWYNRTGTPRVTCLAGGSWSAPSSPAFCEQGPPGLMAPVCSGNPTAPANAWFACPSPAVAGTVCTATCNPGYSGAPTATCQADGTYSALTGGCVWNASDFWFWSIGGRYNSISFASVYYINPAAASPTWVAGPPLSVNRGLAGPAMDSGMANAWQKSIYVYGGGDDGHAFQPIMIRLNVSNLAAGWTPVNPQGGEQPYRFNGVTATLNGIFYYVAGFQSDSITMVRNTSSYNPATNAWTTVVPGAELPVSVDDGFAGYRGCLVALGGSLYYMRGSRLLKWTPGDVAWTRITTQAPWDKTTDARFAACAAYDGKVVQLLGYSAATYDPITGAFAALPGTSAQFMSDPVVQTCPSATSPKGVMVVPTDTPNPLAVYQYVNSDFAALPSYPVDQTSYFMTTVAIEM